MLPEKGSAHPAALPLLSCLLILASALFSCRPVGEKAPLRRVVLLPLNILSDQPSADEMSIGGVLMLRQELLASPDITATAVQADSDGYGQDATESVQITVSASNGKLHGELTDRSYATGRAAQVISADASSYVELIHALALQMDPHAGRFSTTKDAAVRAYVRAIRNPDLAQKAAALNQALSADASFGLAYLSLAELSAGQPEVATGILQRASSQASGFTPLDRARLKVALGARENAPLSVQIKAMSAVAALAPNDPETLLPLGVLEFLDGQPADGETTLRKLLNLEPNSPEAWHQLGLGLLATRRFDSAVEALRKVDANRSISCEIAVCLLLKGDKSGADQVMQQYLSSAGQQLGPVLPLVRANWEAISEGSKENALKVLAGASSSPDAASLASSQAAIWEAESGDQPAAKRLAAAGWKTAASPAARAYAIAAGAAAADIPDLAAKLNQLPMDAGAKASINAYTLFLHGNYIQAAEAWSEAVRRSGDKDLRARSMLAASLDRAGRSAEASKINVEPFAPNLLGGDPYAAIAFGEMRRLLKLN